MSEPDDGIRLQKLLAAAGIGSRRACEVLIANGHVEVNGEIVTRLGTKVDPLTAIIRVNGERLPVREDHVYLALNKPAGVVTTARDPHGRRTVVELVDLPERVVPVGRLDADTTGALLLTNDGELAHRLAHPRYGVEKTYVVDVAGHVTNEVLETLESGVELDDGRTAPARARRLARSRVELILHEGRKHQVKRMLEAVGYPVVRLHRSAYAGISADDLEPGAWRELTDDEVARLKEPSFE
jgi:23S rRNA pseudouridine2605 synthase